MPAPKLVSYRATAPAAAGATVALHPAVPANRALVVSRLLVTNFDQTASWTFELFSPGLGTPEYLGKTTLGPGESWSESGIVVEAGGSITVRSTAANSALAFHVSGQEVDN